MESDETKEDTQSNCDTDSTSKDPPDEPVDSTLHSRDQEDTCSQQQKNKEDEEPMDSDESEDDKNIMCGVMSKRYNYVSFKPLLYYNRELKTYYYKYFKPYSYDHRLLTMGYDCKCPRKVHKTNCSWCDTDTIYIRADLSISEKAAQQQIYKMYRNTINNVPESCGCEHQLQLPIWVIVQDVWNSCTCMKENPMKYYWQS